MIQITTNDKVEFSGETPMELVQVLRNSVWFRENSKSEFMKAVAERCELWDGSQIRFHEAAEFLEDLRKSGFISIREEL